MSTTVQDIVNGALRLIGVLAPTETPTTEESGDALFALNEIIASWNSQALGIYQITRATITLTGAQSYTLATRPTKVKAASVVVSTTVGIPLGIATPEQWAAYMDKVGSSDFGELLFWEDGYPLGKIYIAPLVGTGTLELVSERVIGNGMMRNREAFNLTGAAYYTIGVGGSFATERPAKVLAAQIQAGSVIAQGLDLVSAEAWAAYPRKGASGKFAKVLFYDGGFPTAHVYIAPAPTAGSLEIYTYQSISNFGALTDTIMLPDGYERAFRQALAGEIGPEYGRPYDKDAVNDAKLAIFGLNANIFGPPQPVEQNPSTPVAQSREPVR
jgi:hypothetical protein